MSWPNHQTHVHWLYFLSIENQLLLTESHKGTAHWALTISICTSPASTPCVILHHLCKQPAVPFVLTTIFFFFGLDTLLSAASLERCFYLLPKTCSTDQQALDVTWEYVKNAVFWALPYICGTKSNVSLGASRCSHAGEKSCSYI